MSKYILIISLFLWSCNRKVVGTYYSHCILYGESESILTCNKDSTFGYRFSPRSWWKLSPDSVVKGRWYLNEDTLILISKRFLEERDEPGAIKKSDFPDRDKYLIRRKGLLLLNSWGASDTCVLHREPQ